MKKLLFISSAMLAAVCIVNAQSERLSVGKKLYPVIKNLPTEVSFPIAASPSKGSSSLTRLNGIHTKKNPSVMSSSMLVGYSCYDLQSNNSVGRGIINHGDGTLSFAWTIDDECTMNFLNRGTGYNYWNGGSLLYPGPTARIETVRTGFAQIGLLGNGSEVIMAHKGLPYDFKILKNGTKGSGIWTIADAAATDTVGGEQALWCRIATGGSDGNSIHLIANYFTTPVLNGFLTPMIYSRSTDAGATWNLQSVMLPGYDTSRYISGNAETYSIDADGNTVAIVHGNIDEDVVLWKSTDNGTTFQRTFVDSFAYAPSIDSTGVTGDMDTTSDGTVSVVLAPNGTAHVAYATVRVEVGGYHPEDAELVYWNDIVKKKIIIPITISDVDTSINGGNSTGMYEVGAASLKINNPSAALPPNSRYGNKAFLSQPSISVDGTNIFIIFSLITDADSTFDGRNFRDIWVVASSDGGVTFGPVQNITCSVQKEEYYASMAKRVDNFLHILYQADDEPGNTFNNKQAVANNEIRWAVVEKAKVLAGTAYCSATSGVTEHNTSVFSIADNYPNPTSGYTYFDVTMKQNASISLDIFNNIGQQVYTIVEKLSSGKHTLSVNASAFSSGLYFYTIKSGNDVVSGKMTVVTE